MTLQAPDNVEDMFEYLDFTQPEYMFSSLASSLYWHHFRAEEVTCRKSLTIFIT